jgi:hypothetical protein
MAETNISDDLSSMDLTSTFVDFIGNDKKILCIGKIHPDLEKSLVENNCIVDKMLKFVNMDIDDFTKNNNLFDLDQFSKNLTLETNSYDTIFICESLECFLNPIHLFKFFQKSLKDDGKIIGFISNFLHGNTRLKFLDGDFNYSTNNALNPKHVRFFTLTSLLDTISKSGLFIDRLHRVKSEMMSPVEITLKPFLIPEELIHSIKRDPESQISQYIFAAKIGSKNIDYDWLCEFPTNYVSNDLKNRIDDLKNRLNKLMNSQNS